MAKEVKKKRKNMHLPNNSIVFIIKCKSGEKLKKILVDEHFKKLLGELGAFSMQNGLKLDHITNP